MYRCLCVSLFVLGCLPAVVQAQGPLYAAIDTTTVVNNSPVSGWAVNCASGQAPAALTVSYAVNDATGQSALTPIAATVYWKESRPDVQAAAIAGGCPASTPLLGWTIHFHQPLPLGEHWIVLQIHDHGAPSIYAIRRLSIVASTP